MATIQIRDIPDDAYAAIVRKATANGQSIQRYMRQHLVDFAFATDKAEIGLEVRADLAEHGPLITSVDDVIAAISEGRR